MRSHFQSLTVDLAAVWSFVCLFGVLTVATNSETRNTCEDTIIRDRILPKLVGCWSHYLHNCSEVVNTRSNGWKTVECLHIVANIGVVVWALE